MSSEQREDPYRNFRFRVEIDGVAQAGFSEAIIQDSTSDAIEYREGKELPFVRNRFSLTKFAVLTLKSGCTGSIELYNWCKLVEQGRISEARRNMAVILVDEEGNDAGRWEFVNAWPTKYDAPDLTAKSNYTAVENLEISFETLQKVK